MNPVALLAHHDHARRWPPTASPPAADLPPARAQARAVHGLLRARGEMVRGYKRGFAHRKLWPGYNVFQGIWGTLWNTAAQQAEGADRMPLRRLCQSRIEPEAPLRAADCVTTGSWTDAWPLKPGQPWSAQFNQALPALEEGCR